MRLGIVSDVHCNVEGLRNALELMGDVDELICAGDAVYQFRFSNEVMEVLRERNARYILGNHERTLLGEWGERARIREGNRKELLDYMAGQDYQLETRVNGKKLLVVHGSPFDPHDEYLYPNSPNLQKLSRLDADIVILGHTHYHMALPVGHALVVNPGSAGEPRDHRNGFKLSCAVLDTQSGEVTFQHYDDPSRPKVDPAIVPQPATNAQTEYTPPNNAAWWD